LSPQAFEKRLEAFGLEDRECTPYSLSRCLVALNDYLIGGTPMSEKSTVVAVFPDHPAAESGVKKLADAGFDIKQLSVIGKGYHSDEKVEGFYNAGDRVKFWGSRGAFWGALWGWLMGALYIALPGIGGVVVLGYLAAIVLSAIEGAVVLGGLSALGAALYSVGIPKNSVIVYETALKADQFLVMMHGSAEEAARAAAILGTLKPSSVETHESVAAV
jgi:hypothetical protein